MLKKIVMPSAGQTTNELVIARWLKKVGEPVARGDVLVEIETDKATLEVESFAKGTLLKIFYEQGDTAMVGDVIAYIGNLGDLAGEEASAQPEAAQPSAQPKEEDDYAPIGKRAELPAKLAAKIELPAQSGGYRASPAAKKAARDANVALADVSAGLGKELLRRADVLQYAQSAGQRQAGRQPSEESELVALTSMRRSIAKRMLESAATIPAFTLEVEVDMRALMQLRDRLKEQKGLKPSYHDLFAKAAATALRDHWMVNASWREDGILRQRAVHVGIATSLEGGLVVPVVRDAGAKSLREISTESSALIQKAKEGRLTKEEMNGGTITISNLGMYPLSRFTAIINPPESCILAIGGLQKRVVFENGLPTEVPVVVVTASFDHRVVDGAYGAAFLADYKAYLEDPATMLY